MPQQLNTEQAKNAFVGCGTVIIVLVFVIWFFIPSCDNKKETKSVQEIKKPSKEDAYFEINAFVEKNLKAPSTAKFQLYDTSLVQQLNDSEFVITSYVDSQNGFGAMLRADYGATITFHLKNETHNCNLLYLKSR